MELLKRYSKNSYQGKRLRRMVEMTAHVGKSPVRESVIVPRVQRVDRRLPAGVIDALVQDYRDGLTTPELAKQYELGHGSVIKLLHGRGVVMRRQGLAVNDVPAAAELYRSGQTLSQLGERFGVSPNAVRRALITSGVVMRARGGSKQSSGH